VKKIVAACAATVIGFLLGTVTISFLSTVHWLIVQRPHYRGFADMVRLPIFVFLEALIWTLIGGAMFVLPQAFVILTVYAFVFRKEWCEPSRALGARLIMFLLLYGPVYYFGFRGRPHVAVVLLGISILIGLSVGLSVLNRRLVAIHEK